MNKELFGVYGDQAVFERFREPHEFDRVVEGEHVTVGLRDVAIGIPGRSAVYRGEDGTGAVWGEAYVPRGTGGNAAAALFSSERRWEEGVATLNGSFLAVVDDRDGARVVTDPLRTWECYYTDAPGARVFGTDPVAVAQTIDDPSLLQEPVAEFLHLGVVLEERTVLEQLHRIPFDGYLTAEGTGALDRFSYEHETFDYAAELARRLERAFRRRASLPGSKGLLLSGGYDARAVLSAIDDIDVCYTIGPESGDEVTVARRLATQYDADHEQFPIDERYFNRSAASTRYGQGIKESLHVHHATYTDRMGVDTMYHGAFGDTLLRGHFRPIDAVEIFDLKCPPYQLDPEPDVPQQIAEKFGYYPVWSHASGMEEGSGGPSETFVRRRVDEMCDRWSDRCDSNADRMSLLGIQNQPSLPFRYHLADHFIESFVFADAEIVDWHLRTPPEHRNTQTYLSALRKLDDSVLRHRPPDRPFDSFTLNQIDGFLRRALPMVSGYDGPWPDREALYDRADLDRKLFPSYPELHDLPWRVKLRINDLCSWLELATGSIRVTPQELLEPHVDSSRGREVIN